MRDMWKNTDKTRLDSVHYSVMSLVNGAPGMDALRQMFPDAKANEMNFALFSTSGVHGTYNTIESAEKFILGLDGDGHCEVTFVIVHPRLVTVRYGVCDPATQDDIDFLKKLRQSSYAAVSQIGISAIEGV